MSYDHLLRDHMLRWQKIDPNGPGLQVPAKHGDVGYDLTAGHDVLLESGQQYDVSTNVRVKLPQGVWAEIRPRSSVSLKGLQTAVNVIDNGYTGELRIMLRNMNRHAYENDACDYLGRVQVSQGERIAQLVLHLAVWPTLLEEAFEDDPRRGQAGWGSTGA